MINSQGIHRYNSDLSLDVTFATSGILYNVSPTTELNLFAKLKVQTDSKIVVMSNNYSNYLTTNYQISNILISRYNSNGSIDSSFNQNGSFLIPSIEVNNLSSKILVFNNNIFISDSSSTLSKINSSGILDLTFGNGGQKVIYSSNESDDNSIMSVIQSDGKFLILGNYENTKTSIVRYNVDGTLDTTFAQNEKFISTSGISPHSMALQNDGKILIFYNGSSYFSNVSKIMRLDINGTIDSSFGINGVQEIVIPEFVLVSSFSIKKAKILPDDKIVILGYYDSSIYGTPNIYKPHVIIKLDSNGSFDTSFNTSGYNISNIYDDDNSNYGSEYLNDIMVLNNGKIIVGGSVYYYDHRRCLIARYNSDGSINDSFATNGVSVLNNYPSESVPYGRKYEVNAMDIQIDGKLIINVGINAYNSLVQNNFLIARINTDGTLDSSFGLNGIVETTIENSCNSNSLKVLPNQKIMVSGYSIGSNKNFAMAKFNPDGTLDTAFGNQGKVTTSFNNKDSESNCLILTNDNKAILTGSTNNTLIGNKDFALAKYHIENSLETPLYKNDKNLYFYPNPANDKIYLNKKFKSISVFSIDGKLMYSNQFVNDIDVSFISKGTYIIKAIDSDNFTFTDKLIKQ